MWRVAGDDWILDISSYSRVNSRNQFTCSSASSIEFHSVFTSIIGSTAISTLAFRQSMNSFRKPCVTVINTASIRCYIKVSFKFFKISWDTYFLKYLCRTWSHSRLLIHSSVALFSQFLTLLNVCTFILSKLLIALMGFPRLGVAVYTEIDHEPTKSKQTDVHHAWYVVTHCMLPNYGGLKGWL